MLPNRIAIYLTAAGDLVAALAPFIFDFGGSEKVAAYVASILGVNAVVVTWLNGWQRYEERTALEPLVQEQLDSTLAPTTSGRVSDVGSGRP